MLTMSEKGALKSQMLRHRHVEVVRRDRVEVVQDDHEEEDLEPNVDEVVVDEVLKVDLLLSKMSKTKSVKSMSMLEVDARQNREVDMDLVEEEDVEEVGEQMLMSRCGVVLSLVTMGRGNLEVTKALLPCQKMVPKFSQMGVPRWVDQKSLGLSCHRWSVHAWSSMIVVESV